MKGKYKRQVILTRQGLVMNTKNFGDCSELQMPQGLC